MAQVKVFGNTEHLAGVKAQLSAVIHSCVVEALQIPPEKRFQRFFPLAADDFLYPADRTARYTIIEISLFEGRSVETKRHLIELLFDRLAREVGITPNDVEITIFETPKHNWGIRGTTGDQLTLNYRVEV